MPNPMTLSDVEKFVEEIIKVEIDLPRKSGRRPTALVKAMPPKDGFACVALISKQQAKALLTAFNTNNRPQIGGNVEKLASDINTGNWHPDNALLQFGRDGTLYNGQHRLQGFIASDVEYLAFRLVCNLSKEARNSIDTGVKRRGFDQLIFTPAVEKLCNDNNITINPRFERVLRSVNTNAGMGASIAAISYVALELEDVFSALSLLWSPEIKWPKNQVQKLALFDVACIHAYERYPATQRPRLLKLIEAMVSNDFTPLAEVKNSQCGSEAIAFMRSLTSKARKDIGRWSGLNWLRSEFDRFVYGYMEGYPAPPKRQRANKQNQVGLYLSSLVVPNPAKKRKPRRERLEVSQGE